MIAFVTFISQYSTIPIQNRVMINAENHVQIITAIAEMAEMCAKSMYCGGCEYRVDSFDMKRDTTSCDELHYVVKLLVLPV